MIGGSQTVTFGSSAQGLCGKLSLAALIDAVFADWNRSHEPCSKIRRYRTANHGRHAQLQVEHICLRRLQGRDQPRPLRPESRDGLRQTSHSWFWGRSGSSHTQRTFPIAELIIHRTTSLSLEKAPEPYTSTPTWSWAFQCAKQSSNPARSTYPHQSRLPRQKVSQPTSRST